jgi:hypothetical protein
MERVEGGAEARRTAYMRCAGATAGGSGATMRTGPS